MSSTTRRAPRSAAPACRALARAPIVAALIVAALLALPASAAADVFGPISLVSDGFPASAEAHRQQTLYAHDPALSGNGLYVAFDGYFGGLSGVWRRNLETGEVQPVAVGRMEGSESCAKGPSEATTPCDAELPSISENGQYVSFTTTAPLAPHEDTNKGPDVYVRDMEVPESESCEEDTSQPARPCAFTLASAITVGGRTAGLTYEYSGAKGLRSEEEHYGSVASGRSALSADGREVAFVTTAVSDLDGPHTPALQVAVRNLQGGTTQLVSAAYDPATGRPSIDLATGMQEPVSASEGSTAYGAVYAPNGSPPPFGSPPTYSPARPIGALISADGSTVAWMGQDISLQAQTLLGEALPARYTEPLWRRIAEGPEAPTRRITGGSDPAAPACFASGETALAEPASAADPCEGPFRSEPGSSGTPGIWTGGTGYPVPQLSANGLTVAFLAQAPTFAQGTDFGQSVENLPSDLFVADMAAGLTRVQALRRLTELAGANLTDPSTTAPIVDLGLSPDGSQVAFATQRTSFPLGSPAFISARAAVPGMVELFDADLANETLTRVTQGFEGGPGEHTHGPVTAGRDPYTSTDGALSPSFSADGDLLAFSSTASNLVYGDGNTPPSAGSTRFDGSDAFVVERVDFQGSPAQQYVSPPPPNPPLVPAWLLGVTAVSRRDGSVLLDVSVPRAGSLRAAAQSAVLVRRGRSSRAAARRAAHRDSRGGARARVAARTVASAGTAAAGGVVELLLTLAPRYRALAGRPGGLSGSATVSFAAPGQPVLRESIPVTFLRRASTARPPRRATRRPHRRAGRRR